MAPPVFPKIHQASPTGNISRLSLLPHTLGVRLLPSLWCVAQESHRYWSNAKLILILSLLLISHWNIGENFNGL